MPARAVLYLSLSVVVLAALVGSAVLVFSYRPSTDPATATASSAPADGSAPPAAANGSPGTSPALGSPPATTANIGDALAKQTQPESAAPADLEGYVWPLRNALITSRFTERLAQDGGFVVIDGRDFHDGLDLATFCGDRVRAAHDGVVLYAGRNFDPFLGYLGDPGAIYARLERLNRVNQQPIVVVIDDGNGYRSVYVHLQEALVEAGAEVKAGDVIGLEGATGYATGCHLHYGLIRMDGEWQEVVPELLRYGYPPFVRERVDPLKVLPWGDEYAPQRLRDKVYGTPAPTATSSPAPTATAPPSSPPSSAPTATPRPTTAAQDTPR